MARKSRKRINNPAISTYPFPLRTAAYLCIPDANTNQISESIDDQLMIIKDSLDYRRDLTLTATYIDTNTTGPDFQRRSFRQMIEAIEDNKIDCVIVESLSRLGRNPIEVGYYIESYFPRHSIHLISVTDYIEITDGVSNPDKRNSVNSYPFVKGIKGDCILCPISAKKFDIHTYQIQDQIVLLQHEIGEVNLRIVRQKLLIESLGPNVQKGIITPQESDELRLIFESRQTELTKMRDQLLKKIQQIRNSTTF